MALSLPTLAALAALASAEGAAMAGAGSAAPPSVTATSAGLAGAAGWTGAGSSTSLLPPPANRLAGASARFTATARILRDSARIGAGLAPPHARMVPRPATVASSDGRAVPALIYDVE